MRLVSMPLLCSVFRIMAIAFGASAANVCSRAAAGLSRIVDSGKRSMHAGYLLHPPLNMLVDTRCKTRGLFADALTSVGCRGAHFSWLQMRSLQLVAEALTSVGCRCAHLSWLQSRSFELAAEPPTSVGCRGAHFSWLQSRSLKLACRAFAHLLD